MNERVRGVGRLTSALVFILASAAGAHGAPESSAKKECPAFTVPLSWTETGHSPDGSMRSYATGSDVKLALNVLIRYGEEQDTPMARAVRELKDLGLRGAGVTVQPHPVRMGTAMWVALAWEKLVFDPKAGHAANRGEQYYTQSETGAVLLEVSFIGPKAAFEKMGEEGISRFLATCTWNVCEPPPAADLDLADAAELQKMGLQFFEAGQYDRAIRIYGKALTKAESDVSRAEIYYLLGSAYLAKKDPAFYSEALSWAEKCLAIDPRHWRAIMIKARIATSEGDLEKADALYTAAEHYVQEESPEAKDLIMQHSAVIGVLKMRTLKKKEAAGK